MGLVMVGAIESNDSPVTLDETTPLARLTTDYEVIVVPSDSPLTHDRRPGGRDAQDDLARCRSPAARPAAPSRSWPA